MLANLMFSEPAVSISVKQRGVGSIEDAVETHGQEGRLPASPMTQG